MNSSMVVGVVAVASAVAVKVAASVGAAVGASVEATVGSGVAVEAAAVAWIVASTCVPVGLQATTSTAASNARSVKTDRLNIITSAKSWTWKWCNFVTGMQEHGAGRFHVVLAIDDTLPVWVP
jgi:hypothetical protein